jgi:hypothetical protein
VDVDARADMVMALVAQVLRGCPGRHAWAVYGPPGLARIVTAMTLVVVVELLLELVILVEVLELVILVEVLELVELAILVEVLELLELAILVEVLGLLDGPGTVVVLEDDEEFMLEVDVELRVVVVVGDDTVVQAGCTPPPRISMKTLFSASPCSHPLTRNRRYCASHTFAPSLST